MVLPGDHDLQRARGVISLRFNVRNGETRAVDVFQKSPLRVLFPYATDGAQQEAVLANTAGGIAGGDAYTCEVEAGEGTSIIITMQAAEKIYRASISTNLKIAAGARLAWLPQETIFFDGARLHRSTNVELSPGSELMALEWIVLGRSARGETVGTGELRDSWRVRLGERLIWADSFRIADDVWPHLGRAPLLAGNIAFATMVYFGPHADLEMLRKILAELRCMAAATRLQGMVLMRFAAPSGADLRLGLRSFLQGFIKLYPGSPFREPKMWSC